MNVSGQNASLGKIPENPQQGQTSCSLFQHTKALLLAYRGGYLLLVSLLGREWGEDEERKTEGEGERARKAGRQDVRKGAHWCLFL